MIFFRSFGREVAEDLTQQVLLTVFERLESFEPWHDRDAFEHWVLVIATSQALKHRRHGARFLPSSELVAVAADKAAGLSTMVRHRQQLAMFIRFMETLTPKLRRSAENLFRRGSCIAFAESEEIPLGTAHWRQVKVRRLFREYIKTPSSVV
jgi:DNA-directed RNA polymerase specialized sigma24 family protein